METHEYENTMLAIQLLIFLLLSTGIAQGHIYSQVPSQKCPTLDVTEFTSTYIDGFCKIYLPKEAFVDGDVRAIIQSLDSSDAAHTIEQVLSSEVTPAVFPAYTYSSYVFSFADGNCPPSQEQKLLCVPPEEPVPILSHDAIATLYVLYDAKIKEVLRADSLSGSKAEKSKHILGFFDGIFQEHSVLSTLLSHALSSRFGRLNLALIQFLQQGPVTTGYWAQALGEIDDFDSVNRLFSPAYTATMRKREDGDGSFRLVLVVVHDSGDIVINMESQSYRPPSFIPLSKSDMRYRNAETLGAGVNVYVRRQPGVAVLFSYFAQPGRGSSRGVSCLDYLDILGQHCTSYSSGRNLCPIQLKISKNDLLNAIAERPVYLSTDGAEGDWVRLFTLEAGDILNMCGYWMMDQPSVAIAQEADGAIYFANKDKASPLTFFLLVAVGCSAICICITIILLLIASFCSRLKLYAVDLRWTPYKVLLSEKPKEQREISELPAIEAKIDAPIMCISPLLPKTMSPLLLPRGNAAKKLASAQRKHSTVALAVAGATLDFSTEFPLCGQEPSSVTKDTTHSSTATDSMANSMICAPPTDSTTVFSDDRRDVEIPIVSGQFK